MKREYTEFDFGSHYEYNFHVYLTEKSPFQIYSCAIKENLPSYMDYTTDIDNGSTYPHYINDRELHFRWNQFKDSLTLSYRLITLIQYTGNDSIEGVLECKIKKDNYKTEIIKINTPITTFKSKVRLRKVGGNGQ
jgi:hypothetical protein